MDKERAPGYGRPRAGSKTRPAASPAMIHPAAPTEKLAACDVRWMVAFATSLDDRILTAWALRLENVERAVHPWAYLWQQLARIELRRQHRTIDVTTLDACPLCVRVGLWWRDRRTGEICCLACGQDGSGQ